MSRSRLLSLTKFCLVLIPVGLFGYLTLRYSAWNGHLTVSTDFSTKPTIVSTWYPPGRASNRLLDVGTGLYSQVISGDPVYLNVDVPRAFDRVTATIHYTNPDQQLVEFGVVANLEPWSIVLHGFENKIVDQALAQWQRVDGDGVALLQRPSTTDHPVKQFSSVTDFLSAVPQSVGVGTYRTTVPVSYTDTTYRSTADTLVIDRALRGSHEFIAYAANEDLSTQFSLVDLNNEFNADPISIQVYRDDQLITEKLLPDDGDATASGHSTPARQLTVSLPQVAAGVYRYKVVVDDDIVISHIETQQERFVVKNTVFPINNVTYSAQLPELSLTPTTLYTNASKLIGVTEHTTSFQTISIGQDDQLVMGQLHAPTLWHARTSADRLRAVTEPLGDVELSTTGYFSFTKDSWFDPDGLVQPIDEFTSLSTLDYVVVNTDYHPPTHTTTDLVQTVSIDLNETTIDRKHLQFVLSSPSIAEQNNQLQIKSVTFDFQRPPLWQRWVNSIHD